MAKRKKRRKLSARTVWTLFISYFVVGVAVGIIYLNRNAPDPAASEAARQGVSNAWGLLPIIVILWPIFVVVMLIQALI